MKRVLRWIGIILGGLIALLLMAWLAIYLRGQSLLNATYQTPTIALTLPSDAATIERGKHLVKSVSVCVDCHGEDLGGAVVVDDPAIGYVAGPNLTKGKGGVGETLSDEDFLRAVRYGVLGDGHSVRVMPSDDYQWLSDEDLAAIVAYVRSVPNVDKEWAPVSTGPVGNILFGLGQLPILTATRVDMQRQRPQRVEAGVTKEYGDYLSRIAGCIGCHNPSLSGGKILTAPPDWPEASNLTPGSDLKNWSEQDFINTIRSGINPSGKALNPVMPWARYGAMSDDELKALWAYISTIPAKEYGVK